MMARLPRLFAALSGILGVAMLLTSFALNPGPPAGATPAQALAYINANRDAILLASWLQEIGSFLSLVFALSLVYFARAMTRFAGWMTFFGAAILMTVSLVEVTFYLLVVQGAATGDPVMAKTAAALITAVQHAYSVLAAPAVFIPLGFVLLGLGTVWRVFAYLAFVLGVAFAVLGLPTLLDDALQGVVNILSIVQGFWFLAAAITLLVRAPQQNPLGSKLPEHGDSG